MCQFPKCFDKYGDEIGVCSSHGNCVDYNKCECLNNYIGTNCSQTTCLNISSEEKSIFKKFYFFIFFLFI